MLHPSLEQKEQQQIVLDYVADGGCGMVGLGDTRLGDDSSEVCRMARGVMGRVNDEALAEKLSGLDAQQRAEARAQHGKAASVLVAGARRGPTRTRITSGVA